MLNTSNDQRKLLPNFEQLFATTAQAPGGVARLRELILTLAVQGKLVPQDPSDEPASELLKKIRAEKDRLIAEGKIKKDKPLPAITEDEKPFELPVGWVFSCLGEIGVINPKVTAQDDAICSFVQMSSISVDFLEKHFSEDRPWKDIKKGFTQFSNGDVGLAKITPCFENGKSTVFEDLKNNAGAGTTELHIVRPLAGINPRYILLFLKTPVFLKNGESVMTGSAGQKRVPRSYFESAPLPLPPLAEQSRIVARVEELMRLCDALEEKGRLEHTQHQQLLQAMLDSLTQTTDARDLARHWQRLAQHFDLLIDRPEAVDALEQTIVQLAVRGLLVPQDPKDEPGIQLLEKIKDEKSKYQLKPKSKKSDRLDVKDFLYDLPDGWVWTALQEITLIGPENGLSPKPSNIETKYRCLTLTATTSGDFKGEFYKYVEISDKEAEANFLKENDLLIQRGNSIDYVGIAAIYDGKDDDFIYPDLMMRLRLSSLVNLKYVHLTLISKDGRSYFRSVATGTQGNMPKVNQTAVNSTPIPLPPLAEQSRIVTRVTELRALCQQLRDKLAQARTTQTQLAQAWVEQVAG